MYKYIHPETSCQYAMLDFTFIDPKEETLSFTLASFLKQAKLTKEIGTPDYIVISLSNSEYFNNTLKINSWKVSRTSELKDGDIVGPHTIIIIDTPVDSLSKYIDPSEKEYVLAVVDHKDRNIVPKTTDLTFILYLELKGY